MINCWLGKPATDCCLCMNAASKQSGSSWRFISLYEQSEYEQSELEIRLQHGETALNTNDLLANEILLMSKGANTIIKPDEHGLSRFAFDGLMPLVGMQGKEAIGGHLHLTNYRLVFESHAINRLTGKFSIFLPTIQDIRNASGLLVKKIEVNTRLQKYEFVVWGIPALLAAIVLAKDSLMPESILSLRSAAVADYKKCGDGLQVFQALEDINTALLGKSNIAKVAAASKTPFEASTILNLWELLGE